MRAALFVLLLAACATPYQHWLTDDEDASLRASCEPVGGCVAVPERLWEKIKDLIMRMSGTTI